MNLTEIKEHNASALALLIAFQTMLRIHNETFQLLSDLLKSEELELISFNASYYADVDQNLGNININLSNENIEDMLDQEMMLQNVSTPSNLLKKFSFKSSKEIDILIRHGMLCQVMKDMKFEQKAYIANSMTHFEITSDENPLFELTASTILVEPIALQRDVNLPLYNLYAFESDYITDNPVPIPNTSQCVETTYMPKISVSKSTHMKNCILNKVAIFRKAKLIGICSACKIDYTVNPVNIDDVESFLEKMANISMLVSTINNASKLLNDCQKRCENMKRSCTELEVHIQMSNDNPNYFDCYDGDVKQMIIFDFIFKTFGIENDFKVMNFEDCVGRSHGGFCLGAGLMSIFQLIINCASIYK